MRIISQDGNIDAPYGSSIVVIAESMAGTSILMFPANYQSTKPDVMGVYESRKDVDEILSKLHYIAQKYPNDIFKFPPRDNIWNTSYEPEHERIDAATLFDDREVSV